MKINRKDGTTTNLRGKMPPPSKRHRDRKKEANKKACRRKVDDAKH